MLFRLGARQRPCEFLSEDFLFFSENTSALGPWSRALLPLASKGSVLESCALGLGLEPCVLDFTSE